MCSKKISFCQQQKSISSLLATKKDSQTFLNFNPFLTKFTQSRNIWQKLSLRKINLVQSGATSSFYIDRIEFDQQLSHKINCARHVHLVQYMAGIFCAFLFLFFMYVFICWEKK